MEIFNKSVQIFMLALLSICVSSPNFSTLPNKTVHPDTIPLYYKFGFPASGCKISFSRALHCIFQLKIKAIPLLFKFSRVKYFEEHINTQWHWEQFSYHFACLFFFYISFLKPCCMYIFTPKSEANRTIQKGDKIVFLNILTAVRRGGGSEFF